MNGTERSVSPYEWPDHAVRRLLAVIAELSDIIDGADTRARDEDETVAAVASYTRWARFKDDELDVLSHCIRLPPDDGEAWHEAWLMLGQINVEVERRRQ